VDQGTIMPSWIYKLKRLFDLSDGNSVYIVNPHFSQDFYCGGINECVCCVHPIYAKHKWGAPIGILDVLKVRLRGPQSQALHPHPFTPPRVSEATEPL
jgi:hypothetical protein